MTEIEKLLLESFKELSSESAKREQRLTRLVEDLTKQVRRLNSEVESLQGQVQSLSAQVRE